MSISNDIGSTSAGASGTSGNAGSAGMPQGREMGTADSGGGGMKESVKHLGSVAADKASQLKDSAQEYLHAGREKASEYLDAGREKASEYYEMSKAKAQEWEHSVEEYIREKPLQSVLIAAGVGAVLGFLLRR